MNKEGYGAIFRNNNKQTDKSPDYTGSINIDGKEVKLSCWIATSKLGTKYFQVRVSNKPVEKQETPQEPVQEQTDFVDDSVPF
jgi:uncharacterized protein (DUF736 family)